MDLPRARTIAAVLFAGTALASAANWPQWRGPHLQGWTDESGLPVRWSKTENVAWVTPMPGLSAATPIVWGDRVFVSSVDKANRDLLALCLDVRTGKERWRYVIGQDRPTGGGNNMASPSAVTDGTSVWFYTGTGRLFAFTLDGRELWRRDLGKDHGAFTLKYGYSSSPLLYQDRLYIPVLQAKDPNAYRDTGRTGELPSFLLAIDPATGKELWKQVRPTDAVKDSRDAYITPMPCKVAGRTDIVLVGGEYVTGHDAATGEERWRWEFTPHGRVGRQRVVSSAVVGDGLIYAVRSRGRSLHALRAGGKGRLGDDAVAWSASRDLPDVPTPLLWHGRLYVLSGNRKVMTCFEPKTGEVKWRGKLKARAVFRASPTGADGKVYCISKAGDVVVLAEGDAFKVLAEFSIGGRDTKSSIAVAGGRLFVRTGQNLYCVAKSPGQ